MTPTARNYMLLAGLAVVLLAMPLLVSEYRLNLIITIIIYSLFALSYNVLFGQAGLLSFGHAAYFGMGAYTAMILMKRGGLSIIPGIFAGGIGGALLGLIFGIFVVRLGGTYFALLTLAFNELIYAVAEKWRSMSGGEDGIACQRPDLNFFGLGKLELFSTVHWYYFVLIVVCASAAYLWRFTRTPLGRLNLAMRENEERAQFLGYNVYASKLVIYVLSAFFAGLAGALAGAFQEFISVTVINMDKSTDALLMTFVGGGGTFWGPILGAATLTYLNDVLSSMTEHWALIQGILFVLLVMYAPHGLSGFLVQVGQRIRGKKSTAESGG